jgi:hypothetical protein
MTEPSDPQITPGDAAVAAEPAEQPQELALLALPVEQEGPTQQTEQTHQIPVAEPAPLVAVPERPNQLLGVSLQLLNQLLARIGATPFSNLAELLPALRVLALLLLAGFVLKLTGATLGALNEIPMLGRLLELVGLISALNFLARNALRSQKRAELLARIQQLRREFLG